MAKCYLCGSQITNFNKSKEHIIPNAIGGKLVSYDIWCSSCKDFYGNIDTNITEPLKPIASMLDILRNRGENQSFSATGADGIKLIIDPGGGAYIRHPSVKEKKLDDKTEISISVGGRTHKERLKNLKKILKGKQRKHPQITDNLIDEFLKKAKSEKAYPDHTQAQYPQLTLGGDDNFKAATKIGLHICLYHYGKPKNIEEIKNYIKKGETSYERVWFSFDYCPFIESEIVANSYVLEGNKSERILFVYLDFLSIYPLIVLLDNDYDGPTFVQSYEHNIIDNTEKEPVVIKRIDRKSLIKLIDAKIRKYDIFKARLNRVIEFYYRKNAMPLEKSRFS